MLWGWVFRSRDQAAWCDELSKWHHPRATWDNLQLGLRRGRDPRAVVTTTPRKCATLSAILDAEDSVVTGGGTRTNVHLPPAYLRAVEAAYAGTRLGAQELDGVMPTDVEGSLWPAGLVEKSRLGTPAVRPELVEGSPSFSLVRGREGQGSDKLSPNGAVFRFSRITCSRA